MSSSFCSDKSILNSNDEDDFSCETIKIPNLHLSLKFQSEEKDKEAIQIGNNMNSWKHINIIIADDEPLILQSTKKVLSAFALKAHYILNILEAFDGYELLYEVTQKNSTKETIDLIICDENMTYCNGNECKRILTSLYKDNKLPLIPFFILSANINNSYGESSNENILSKPLCSTQLLYIFQNLFNK